MKKIPMPSKEEAWAFTWKVSMHLSEGGVAALLLPSMGFLHNYSNISVEARNQFFSSVHVRRIIDFADLRFILFSEAVRPTALFIFENGKVAPSGYRIEYWAPKADLNSQKQGLLTLNRSDRKWLHTKDIQSDPLLFKRSLWMSGPESKLFNYIERYPRLDRLTISYKAASRMKSIPEDLWVIGRGMKPGEPETPKKDDYGYNHIVDTVPYLPVEALSPLIQTCKNLVEPFDNSYMHRRGFDSAFSGQKILIPRGITTAQRLRASYCEEALSFQDIIQAIKLPSRDIYWGKLFTAICSSKLILWYVFHGTTSFGSERPEIKPTDVMRLPFPKPEDMINPKAAQTVADDLVAIIDSCLKESLEFTLATDFSYHYDRIDALVYKYFNLSDEEITLVDDTIEYRIPAIQPTFKKCPKIWREACYNSRLAYAKELTKSLSDWLDDDCRISASLVAKSSDLAILKLTLGSLDSYVDYKEEQITDISSTLKQIQGRLNSPISENFQLMPDYRVFVGKSLFLIKPLQLRYWLRSKALEDADSIAIDLQEFATA